jgi:predicted RNA-binding Zn-ribbon protein involved in translation (DUF1610 family)
MLTTELPRAGGENITVVPSCPNCGRPMHPARTALRADTLPDASVFKCGECGVWITEAGYGRRVV